MPDERGRTGVDSLPDVSIRFCFPSRKKAEAFSFDIQRYRVPVRLKMVNGEWTGEVTTGCTHMGIWLRIMEVAVANDGIIFTPSVEACAPISWHRPKR